MRVVVSNPYVFNKRERALVDWLDHTGFTAALLNEMKRLHDNVDRLGHIASGKPGTARGSNVVLTRIKGHGEQIHHLCDGVEGSKVWKDRYAVRYVVDGVAYWCVHANAVIQNRESGRWRDNEGARRWHNGMERLLPLVQADLDAGLDVSIGGDFNWSERRGPKDRAEHGSPRWLFESLGLKHVNREVMWLAWSKGLALNRLDIEENVPGADGHPALIADFERKGTGMRFVPYHEWSYYSERGATKATHPIGSTLGVTFHYEGPKMGGFPHSKCAQKVRAIQRFHRITRGWADIAYNAVVCPHGVVFEGRGRGVMSAANGWYEVNQDWYAVCYLGGQGDPFTDAGKEGFIHARMWLVEGGAGPRVNGHRDHKATACPGDPIYNWLNSVNWASPNIEEDDMPSPKDLWDYDIPERIKKTEVKQRRAARMLGETHALATWARDHARAANRRTERIERALAALADSLGDEVGAAVREALKDAVVAVDVTVSTPEE